MNTIKIAAILLLTTIFTSSTAIAEKKLAEKLANSDMTVSIELKHCDTDAAILCPGLSHDGEKTMMCLMAYEDNLSVACQHGIIEAALIFELGMLDINHSINACESDADKYCLDIKPGAGRIVSCLRDNKSNITKGCTTALKETGLWNLGAK
jgi:hypothetical protein